MTIEHETVETTLTEAGQTVLDRIEEENVNYVRLQFTDILGTIKNVSIPAHQVERLC